MSDIWIPCLSLHQIWANAMKLGLKTIETRDGDRNPVAKTKYRGDIAIHAARKKWNPSKEGPGLVERVKLDRSDENLDYGAVICIVELVDIKDTNEVWDSIGYVERMYGNYWDGRKALITKNLRVLEKPVPLPGCQGWFRFAVPEKYQHLVRINQLSLGL